MTDAHQTAISVRPAAPADVPLILKLVRELAEYERALDQVVATEESLHRFLFGKGYGRGPLVEALVGELDGRPEGFALYFSNFSTWLATSGIYLEDLFVRPAVRGRGLGKALLVRLAQIAVERGCGRLEWAVLNWNEPAIGFYRSLGAEPLDEWTVFRLSGDSLRRVAHA
jgi:GNAT superfamily N-acetyltransferase